MSTIFGVFNRDSEPVSEGILQAMQEGAAYWNPDSSGLWREGEVALGHRMLWNTPESKLEALPDKQGHLVISMDARLDNREELAQQLDLTDKPLAQMKESEFILAAYQKWGEDCPEHLIGDFAFVIWDEGNQQLFCARDHVGVKQFYFHLADEYFICANDLRVLVSHPAISTRINDETVANFLVNNQLESDILTFFESIEKLPPAHSVTITANRVRKKCYWRLEDAPRIQLENIDAHSEKLRELLEQAVHDRLRSDYPITSHLSGGLDSSAIAVIAARELRDKNQRLLAFNWLHEPEEGDDPEHYEWANSQAIAKIEGIEHHFVPLTVDNIYQYMKKRTISYGDTSTFWYEYSVRAAAQKRMSRTILTGWGGDELSTYHGQAYYVDLFSQGKIFKVLKEMIQAARKQNKNQAWRFASLLYHQVVLLLVPRKIYRFMPRSHNISVEHPLFVIRSFRSHTAKETKKEPVLTMQSPRTIRKHMLAFWNNGHIQARIESWATAATFSRLEYSYPLLDKRVIEYVIGLPAECFVKNNIRRYLFRLSVKNLLPQDILWANSKVENNRAEQLVSLCLSAWALFVKDGYFNDEKSNYLDKNKLIHAINYMNNQVTDRSSTFLYENIDLFESIETSMALLLSEKLRQPLANNE